MNCVLYARVSTQEQAEIDLSIPAQLQAMRDYARQHGWVVVAEYIEPGISAKTTERPSLQRMLAALRAGEPIGVVLVHKIDRLARNVADHATIRVLLKQLGIRLASVVENVDNTVSGQLVENIMASFAEFYSANLAEEVKKGMRQKILKGGWPHRPPRGYVTVRTGLGRGRSRVEMHPREGALIRSAFELYASGAYSLKTLSRRLANDGLTASSGRPVALSYLRDLLVNPFYAGILKWKDLEVPGVHPPLVSLALFEKVQATIKERYKDSGVKGSLVGFPLRGFAICAECRGRMTAEQHDRWGYYRCGRNAFKSQSCRAKFCNTKKAHQDIERICQQVRLTQAMVDAIRDAAERLIQKRVAGRAALEEQLAHEEASLLQREMQLTAAFTAGDLAPNDYKQRIAALRSDRGRVQEGRQDLSVDPRGLATKVARTLNAASSLRDVYDSLSDQRRAELLREVFSTIVLSHEGVVGFTLRKPFDRLISSGKGAEHLSQSDCDELAESLLAA